MVNFSWVWIYNIHTHYRCVSDISTDLYLRTYIGTSMDLILSCSYRFVYCQYPGTGVPLTIVWRHGAHTASSSRVENSTRPHQVDGFRAATWPEKTIYSRISTVGPDPHRKVSNPHTYGPDLRVRSRTSTGMPGPLERVPDPPVQGPGHSQQGPRIPGQRIPRPWSRSGGGPEPTRVRTIPRTLPLPAQAETRCYHVADYPWCKPTGRAWHKASRPRVLCIYCG
jgi:hypothetical protein